MNLAARAERPLKIVELAAAHVTAIEVPDAHRRELFLEQVHELGRRQMVRHVRCFLRFASAWKKFALAAPTELPRMPAISS